jgi:hypothetical protein
MDLPNLFNKIKSSQDAVRRLLAIEISTHTIKSAVWEVSGFSTRIITTGSVQAWESESEDDLLIAVDTSLSEALAGLDEEPNEVIFGLPETWVGQDSIAETKKPILKTICKKLALKPVGFVVTTEAIVHYLRDREGGPPSAILVQVSSDQVIVSLVKLGVLQGAQVVGRSASISSDVEEGLARFPAIESFPSRLILFNGKDDLEAIKQELIAFDWQSKLPFLHIPEIETLPKDGTIKAIAIAGGAEVAKTLTHQTYEGLSSTNEPLPPLAVSSDVEEPLPATPLTEDPSGDIAAFGFSPVDLDATGDFSDLPAPSPQPLESLAKQQNITSFEANITEADTDANVVPVSSDIVQTAATKRHFALPKISFPKKIKFPSLRLPRLNKARVPTVIITGFLFLVVLTLGGLYAYWTYPSAELTVYFTPEKFDREITFTIDPAVADLDLDQGVIPGEMKIVEQSGSKQSPATGTKTVGERAKGKIVIYNRTLSSKTLPSGTSISGDNLKYTLDQDVTIASASTKENADFSITRTPSSSEVLVTAVDIGNQYNLAQDTQFAIANFATEDFVGKAISPFAGGSSREIRVISQADKEAAYKSLIAELKSNLQSDLSQSADNQGLVSAGEPEITAQTYSHEPGEEASAITLNLSIKQQIFLYNTTHINQLAQHNAQNKIPSGYILLPDKTNTAVKKTTINEDGTVTASAAVTIFLIKEVDTAMIAQRIKGQYPLQTEDFFRSLPGFSRSKVVISPTMPAKLNTYPRRAQNINVIIEPVISLQ